MSNLKKELFIALSDHLEAKLIATVDLPAAQWIDKDLGQFELMEEGVTNIPLPAVLISFPDTDYETMVGGDQTGTGAIRLRIGFENYYDANAGNPDRIKALQFFEFNEAVHKAIMSFTMQKINGVKRVAEAEDLNHKSVIITEVIYEYTLFDENDLPGISYTSADSNVTFSSNIPKPDYDTGFVIPGK
jgi:hypothetical protein